MRKLIAMVAVLAVAALPAIAGVGTALPVGSTMNFATMNAQSGVITPGISQNRVIPIYADLNTALAYLNQGSGASYPLPVGDDIHATSGGTVTSFVFGYYVPTSVSGAGPFAVTIKFWPGDPTDSDPPGFGGAASLTSFTLTGLPGGVNAFNITGLSVPVTADFYIEQDWAGNGVLNGGPLLTGNSGGTVGYSHDGFSQTGSMWTLSSGTWSDFYYSVDVAPEPGTIALLALSGLAVLRRRR
ncbi:MAG TPA: PEP-CTERM sorting domain-containing protein [Phycisphaerae bacterium]|nr:PEP-CTERM sorting domain-containing protein [Phycisphaerae bacterium]